MAGLNEVILRIKTDFDTKEISLGEAELKKLGLAGDKASQQIKKFEDSASRASKKLDSELNKAFKQSQADAASWSRAVSAAGDFAFKAIGVAVAALGAMLINGFKQIQETEQALLRAGVAASRAGVGFDELRRAAEGIVSPLIESEDKLNLISDIVSKGFDPSQAQALANAMVDLAAAGRAAGESVSDSAKRMIDAFVKGKIAGDDLIRIFPNLKNVGADTLKSLATGTLDAAEKQKVFNAIMRDAEPAIGAAAAAAGTFDGIMTQLKIAFNDASEALATGFIGGVQQLIPLVKDLTSAADGNASTIEKLGYWLGVVLTKAIQAVVGAIKVGQVAFNLLQIVFNNITQAAMLASKGFIDFAANVVRAMLQVAQVIPGQEKNVELLRGALNNLVLTSLKVSAAMKETSLSIINNAAEAGVASIEAVKLYDAFFSLPDPITKTTVALTGGADALVKTSDASKKAADAAEKLRLQYEKFELDAHIRELKAIEEQYKKNVQAMGAAIDRQLIMTKTAADGKVSFEGLVAAIKKYGDGVKATIPQDQAFYNLLLKKRDAMVDAGQATLKLSADLQKLAEEEKAAAAAAANFAAVLGFVGQALSALGAAIGGTFGAALGAAESAFNSFWETGKAIMEKTGSMVGSWAGAIGAGAGVIGDAVGGEVGSAIATIGKFTATGAMFGPWGAAIGAGIGVAIVAIKSLKKDWNETTSNIIENVMGIIGVSAELGKKIAEMAKEIGDASTAATLSLVAMMDDVGINADNFDEFAKATRDVFSFLERGQIDAGQATELLSGAFARLREAGTDSFGLIGDELKELITLSKQFGLEIPAITQFFVDQIGALTSSMTTLLDDLSNSIDEAFTKIPEGMGGVTVEIEALKNDAIGFAGILLAAFNQVIESGGSVAEALAAISPNLGQLRDIFKDLGLSMGDFGLGFLNQMDAINKKFPEQTAAINAATQAMIALANMGLLTANSFSMLESRALSAFDKINKDGKVSKAELESIRPTLMILAKLALEYGYALDPATIALLKQAGLWDEVAGKPKATGDATETAMDRAATAMEKVAVALEQIVAQFWEAAIGADALTGAINGIPTDIDINVGLNVNDSQLGKLKDMAIGIPQYATGPPTLIRAAQIARLDPGDIVIPPLDNSGRPNNWGGGVTVNITINGTGLNENTLKRVATQSVIDAMRKSGPLSGTRR